MERGDHLRGVLPKQGIVRRMDILARGGYQHRSEARESDQHPRGVDGWDDQHLQAARKGGVVQTFRMETYRGQLEQ